MCSRRVRLRDKKGKEKQAQKADMPVVWAADQSSLGIVEPRLLALEGVYSSQSAEEEKQMHKYCIIL